MAHLKISVLICVLFIALFLNSFIGVAKAKEKFLCVNNNNNINNNINNNYNYQAVKISSELDVAQRHQLLAQNPKFVNNTIVPSLGGENTDVANTLYFAAYSDDESLLGYVKMTTTEQFMGKLLDLNFYEQELFGFSGWRGFHVYEVVALNDTILYKLFKRVIHQLKQDPGRYYLSLLCTTELLAKSVMDNFRFTLALKEPSRRFYPSTLYTLVYYK